MANKIKMPTFVVQLDGYAIEDEDGVTVYPRVGEWVRFKKRLPARLIKLMIQIMNVQALESGEADTEMGLVMAELVPYLAKQIVAWNLTDIWDEDGPAMAEPSAETLWDLDLDEVMFLNSALFERLETPKAPK